MALENILGFDNSKGIVDVFMEKPNKYKAALMLAQDVLREQGDLSPMDREIVAAYTSSLNGCKYCTGSHIVFSEDLGADSDDLKKITNNDYVGHRLESIFNFVKKLTLSPSSLEEKDYQNVFDAGFSKEELKDAIAVCAAFNFFNRIVEGHGIVNDDINGWKQASVMISKYGYDQRYM